MAITRDSRRYRFMHWLRKRVPSRKLAFTMIYHLNDWGSAGSSGESLSGRGSELAYSEGASEAVRTLIGDHGVESILDAPCGDVNWMSRLDLAGVRYTGADIVRPLIERNRERFADRGFTFEVIDIVRTVPPPHDLILCRDCLVHLPARDVLRALRNFSRSGAKYLLTTTFTELDRNKKLKNVGRWRPIDLTAPPFNLPAPDHLFPDPDAGWDTKFLGLWKLPIEGLG